MRRAMGIGAVVLIVTCVLTWDLAAAQFCAIPTDIQFCTGFNLTTTPSNISDLTGFTNDRLANESHAAFAIQVDLYDCRKWYSLWTCTDCIAAYKAWVCATMFRNCENGTTLPVCRSLCFDVVRKCPPSIEFTCPTDPLSPDYGDVPGNCTSFGLWNRASASVAPSWLLLLGAVAAALTVAGLS